MSKPNQKNKAESGNVIVIILLAVGLFAALNYAFTSSSRTSSGFISDAQAEAYASEIIAYGNEVKQAVKRLQLRGCSDTEISFENNVVSGYTNSNSPTDNSCHIFDVAGGGLNWKNQNNSSRNLSDYYLEDYIFNGSNMVQDLGQFAGELSLFAEVSLNVCNKINNNISDGLGSTPAEDVNGINLSQSNKFIGVYSQTAGLNAYPKVQSACFHDNSTSTGPNAGYYYYYNVLISR
ncbi:MAG: hypothetical protein AAF988_08225 [Pseudomonadota bacterium]